MAQFIVDKRGNRHQVAEAEGISTLSVAGGTDWRGRPLRDKVFRQVAADVTIELPGGGTETIVGLTEVVNVRNVRDVTTGESVPVLCRGGKLTVDAVILRKYPGSYARSDADMEIHGE